MNIQVSKIKHRAVRRAVIAVSYPFAAILGLPCVAWNCFIDVVEWQITLAKSAVAEWRK